MDHRVTPCHDEDFTGYVETREVAKVVTGEHTIPWPPVNVHRHPSTVASPLMAMGCVAALFALWFVFVLGLVHIWQWLF